MQGAIPVELAGQCLELLPQGGVFWPAQQALIVADLHLGKEASFRKSCIPVPSGATEGTLGLVASMLELLPVNKVIFLGDLFHAKSSASKDVLQTVDGFFERFDDNRFLLTIGNHDRNISALLDRWPIQAAESIELESIEFAHHPLTGVELACRGEEELRVCGHLHPAARLSYVTDSLRKLPCFWYTDRQLILPAIGEFTGTHRIQPGADDRVWVIADSQVIEVKTATARL